MAKTKKVVISDMDNTLCDSCKPVSLEMALEIERLVKDGYTFAVIAGSKPEHILEQVCRYVDATIYALGNSGTNAYLWENKKFEYLFSNGLSEEQRTKIKSSLEELCKEFSLITLTSKEDQIQDRVTQITFSALGRNAPSKLKEEYDPSKEKRKRFIEYLKPRLPEFEIKIGGTTSLDITKGGNNKGEGIRKFCNRYGFKAEECLFFGDGIFVGGNDYSIIGVVDYVQVKNPKETLLELRKL